MGVELFSTDRQTDRQTLIVPLRYFAKRLRSGNITAVCEKPTAGRKYSIIV